jgi:uncharacterized protein (DUF2062 family)
MSLQRWFQEHSLRLLAIRDTPEAIAGGVAIGIFFGFTPLFGLKTLSAILFAWLTRSNIIAAVIATTLHDLLLPFMPVVFLWEYDIGYLLLHDDWPQKLTRLHLRPAQWWNWTTFLTVGKPLLLGSVVVGAPVALLTFLITRAIVARHQRRKHALSLPADAHDRQTESGGTGGPLIGP